MTGKPRPGVVVAVPAHNEEDLLPLCLDRVLAAIDHAREAGAVDHAVVSVVAHRCTDRTADLARQRLAAAAGQSVGRCAAAPDLAWVVLDDRTSATVADVRRAAVDAVAPLAVEAAADPSGPPAGEPTPDAANTWLFNTDADSLVPPDWITGILQVAAREQAVAVAGLVEVAGWHPPPRALQAYEALVARGIHGARHDHAYGANLAVRLDAYRSVGGFSPRRHGEDYDLLRRLRAAGLQVATPLTPRVVTSGREDPRCPSGLGALLHRLVSSARG